MQPSRKEVLTDPLLRKGHSHKPKINEPKVCEACDGHGYVIGTIGNLEDCLTCGGEGVMYD